MCQTQIVAILQHYNASLLIFILQLFITGQDEFPAPLIILTQRSLHRVLKPFAYLFYGPCNLADKMVFIHHDFCIWEESFRMFRIGSPHIADEKSDFLPLFSGNTPPIVGQMILGTVRKNIQNALLYWINQNTLVFSSRSIAFEFINGKSFRQPIWR